MGLNLTRKDFMDWIEERVRRKDRELFLKKLEKHVGNKIEIEKWTFTDNKFPRVGSYTTYNIFILCLIFLTEGDFEKDLEPDEDIELEALKSFRNHLKPASEKIPYTNHFLNVGDSDTIFIPIFFENPFEFEENYVASKIAAENALESFAAILKFDLKSSFDDEGDLVKWIPMATAKNVARIIYQFFKEKPDTCISYI